MTGIEFDRHGETAILTFARPGKKNAITYDMWSAIPELVADVEHDPTVTVLVLTGAGQEFSAGADIGEFRTLRSSAEGAVTYDKAVERAVQALRSLHKPSIAMIRGHCVGGGCQLAVACDLRFAARGARFGITPAKLGIVYDFPSTRALVDLVGPAHARYLLLSGELIDAARAREIGLVNDVVEPAGLEASTLEFARTLGSRSQLAVRGMNRVIEKVLAGAEDADEEVVAIRRAAVESEDYAEGVAAFLERRPPRFTYR